MNKNTNNTICSQGDFERFKSIYERFMQHINGLLDSHSLSQLDDDVESFWPIIIEIGKKVGVDLTDKLDVVFRIREDASIEPVEPNCRGWTGEGVEEAIESVYLEYEDEKKARKEAIADLDKVMAALYALQPHKTSPTRYESIKAFFWKLYETTVKAIFSAVLEWLRSQPK